jgi:hypothetical protein
MICIGFTYEWETPPAGGDKSDLRAARERNARKCK